MQTSSEKKRPKIPLSEKLKSLPEIFGIRLNEEPPHQVVHKYAHVEIRRYEPMLIAETVAFGEYRHASEDAFLRLASYIFGEQRPKTTIEMTAPVFQEKSDTGWRMGFVLPKRFTFDTAPKPKDSGISLRETRAHMVAVWRYSGTNDEAKMLRHIDDLSDWLVRSGRYRAISVPRCAQYDGPHALPFLRRNEIQVDVEVLH